MKPRSVVILLLGWTGMLVFGSVLVFTTVTQQGSYAAWLIPFAFTGVLTAACVCGSENC